MQFVDLQAPPQLPFHRLHIDRDIILPGVQGVFEAPMVKRDVGQEVRKCVQDLRNVTLKPAVVDAVGNADDVRTVRRRKGRDLLFEARTELVFFIRPREELPGSVPSRQMPRIDCAAIRRRPQEFPFVAIGRGNGHRPASREDEVVNADAAQDLGQLLDVTKTVGHVPDVGKVSPEPCAVRIPAHQVPDKCLSIRKKGVRHGVPGPDDQLAGRDQLLKERAPLRSDLQIVLQHASLPVKDEDFEAVLGLQHIDDLVHRPDQAELELVSTQVPLPVPMRVTIDKYVHDGSPVLTRFRLPLLQPCSVSATFPSQEWYQETGNRGVAAPPTLAAMTSMWEAVPSGDLFLDALFATCLSAVLR